MIMRIFLFLLLCNTLYSSLQAQAISDKFKQLDTELPTPNTYRTASGAPGHAYWQQRADYDISVTLDDKEQRIYGEEVITYFNHSPDALHYIWLQLDQNLWHPDSDTRKIQTQSLSNTASPWELQRLQNYTFDGGFKLDYVQDANGKNLPYTINKTMMRIDLPQPLPPNSTYILKIKWWYNINDRMKLGGRSGYEYFPDDQNYIYAIAQFYPRMVMYNEVYGWQHKQFLGRGEFTLTFGNYRVRITAPADHIIAATGVLQNPDIVLSENQQQLFKKATTSFNEPVVIVSEAEARSTERKRADGNKTWEYYAEDVRDFAFASSRKFIWDAMAVPFGDKNTLAMSYYPKEGNPLWGQYSTRAVAHTLKTYSKYTFDYPYPAAISVHTADIGMEYPMICFNWGRPESDGTYTEQEKNRMLGVIIHEVGHNFFPMIVNSDERQWTWMDEGLNTFLQYLTEQEWDKNFPSRRGPAYKIVDYMKSEQSVQNPIMVNSESIIQFGNNAYGKPAAALNILRETVMGRELFDFAFKQYAQRWKFKHPTPADFFRTMEDASAVDLDWFWRGWFYSTDHVDIAIDSVKWYHLDTKNPDIEKPLAQKEQESLQFISDIRNKTATPETLVEKDKRLQDFYVNFDKWKVREWERDEYQEYLKTLSDEEKALLNSKNNYYEVQFRNVGGLVMPLIVQLNYTDGSSELLRIPAEIWAQNNERVSKVFVSNKTLSGLVLDPYLETADTDTDNNYYPPRIIPSRFELFKEHREKEDNLMQKMKKTE
ncbi:MAG: M1 family metallopeptidase [Sphingobacteriales bacterium]|nr:M1 family metallopeptidase [Sphingobacteriales bacterium]